MRPKRAACQRLASPPGIERSRKALSDVRDVEEEERQRKRRDEDEVGAPMRQGCGREHDTGKDRATPGDESARSSKVPRSRSEASRPTPREGAKRDGNPVRDIQRRGGQRGDG